MRELIQIRSDTFSGHVLTLSSLLRTCDLKVMRDCLERVSQQSINLAWLFHHLERLLHLLLKLLLLHLFCVSPIWRWWSVASTNIIPDQPHDILLRDQITQSLLQFRPMLALTPVCLYDISELHIAIFLPYVDHRWRAILVVTLCVVGLVVEFWKAATC